MTELEFIRIYAPALNPVLPPYARSPRQIAQAKIDVARAMFVARKEFVTTAEGQGIDDIAAMSVPQLVVPMQSGPWDKAAPTISPSMIEARERYLIADATRSEILRLSMCSKLPPMEQIA